MMKGGTAFDIDWAGAMETPASPSVEDERKAPEPRAASDLPTLQVYLQDFQSQGLLDFGSVTPLSENTEAHAYVGELELVNRDGAHDVSVSLERFTNKHGFSIEDSETIWNVPAGGSCRVRICWQPREAGGVRQALTLSFLNPNRRRVRVGAFLCGVAKEPETRRKPGPSRTARATPPSRAVPRSAATTIDLQQRGSPADLSARAAALARSKRLAAGSENAVVRDVRDEPSAVAPLRERAPNAQVPRTVQGKKPAPQASVLEVHEPAQASKTTAYPRPVQKAAAPRTLQLRRAEGAKDREEALQKAQRKDLKMRRVLFDDKWMEKQERGFAAWLNFVMNPDTEDDAADQNAEATVSANPFAELARKQRDASVQRIAYTIYHSNEMENIAFQVDREIASGGLAIRTDKDLFKDLGLRKLVLDLLQRYNQPWLRLGLATVLGQQVPRSRRAVKRFATTYFLGDPELDETFRDSKKGLFDENPEYKSELRRRTLRRFLMLVLFLDRAKKASVIDSPSCLFCTTSPIKASAEMVIAFTKEFLSGEGNVIRHLQHACGYAVAHKQTVLDEFDFTVSNLATDLRDGLRLTRAVELLTANKDRTLSQLLRVPAVSRLQKLHNVGVALKELEEHGIDLGAPPAPDRSFSSSRTTSAPDVISSKDVVDGHRRKTLALLWKMIAKWKLSVIMPVGLIRDETRRVKARHGHTAKAIMKKSLEQARQQRVERATPEDGVVFSDDVADLLLEWCQAVCAHHGVRISNLTTSMASGRALCLLIHHYHPRLLEREAINETVVDVALRESPGCADADIDWIPFEVQHLSRAQFRKALVGEQANFRLVNDCAGALGCVPVLLPSFDSENVPEEKLVLLFMAYLCSRLLASRDEIAAAIKIQRLWLQKRRGERFKELGKRAEGLSVKLQALARGHRARVDFARARRAVVKVQSLFRARVTQDVFLACLHMITVVQSVVRRHQVGLRILRLKQRSLAAAKIQGLARGYSVRCGLAIFHLAATVIQARVRGSIARCEQRKECDAAIKLQAVVRGRLLAAMHGPSLAEARSAATVLQSAFRARLAQRSLQRSIACVERLQAFARQTSCRARFALQRAAAVRLQALGRSMCSRQEFSRKRTAAVARQGFARGRSAAAKFGAARSACVRIQAAARAAAARSNLATVRRAVIKLQAMVRQDRQQMMYQYVRRQVTVIQSLERRRRTFKLLEQWQNSATRIQALRRGRACRAAMRNKHTAATALQTAWRVSLAKTYRKEALASACRIEAFARTIAAQGRWRRLRAGVTVLQGAARMRSCRRRMLAQIGAITRCQAAVRAWAATTRLASLKRASVMAQSRWRRHAAVLEFSRCKQAAVRLQAFARSRAGVARFTATSRTICRLQAVARRFAAQSVLRKHLSAVRVLQAFARMASAKSAFECDRAKVIHAQSFARRWAATRRYRSARSAAVLLQAFRRGRIARRAFESAVDRIVALQGLARGFLSRCEGRRNERASVRLQSTWRGKAVRRELAKSKAAAVRLQALLRGCHARRRLVRFAFSVTVLQARLRGMRARTAANAQLRAVMRLQTWARTNAATAKFASTLSAVRRIQSLVRGGLFRQTWRRLAQAATQLQALHRGRCARAALVARRLATTRIQACWRKATAQQAFIEVRCAVSRMQALARGAAARRSIREGILAVVTLQAHVRGRIARRAQLRRAAAAVVLQTAWRTSSTKTQFVRSRSAVVTLQAFSRLVLVRAELRQSSSAACLVQSAMRGFVARSRMTRAKRGVVALQALCRGRAARRAAGQQRCAAVVLQAAWRGSLVRTKFMWCMYCVTTVQSLERRRRALREWQKACGAIKCVQRFVRAHCLAALNQRAGIVGFQSLWRGYAVRKARSAELVRVEKKLTAASQSASESMTLGSRTRSALAWLLRSKDLAHVLKACITLQICTAASRECAESFLETDASDVLFALIRSCNRSEPHVRVLEVALAVLVQVAAHDQDNSFGRLFAAESNSLLSLVDLMQIFRDKPKIASLSLMLLDMYCTEPRRTRTHLLADHDLFKRLCALEQVLRRKAELVRHNPRHPKPSGEQNAKRAKANKFRAKELSEKQQHVKLRGLLQRLGEM